MNSDTVIVIPARSGSKRIIDKNIRQLGGVTMLERAVLSALRSNVTADVFVDTDSENYAAIAKSAGAKVPFLRKSNSDDISTISDATIEFIKRLESEYGKKYSTVIQLMANCPFKKPETISHLYSAFLRKNRDYQISSFKFPMASTWWAHVCDERGKPKPLFPEKLNFRSQDLDETFFPTGSIWIANVDKLLDSATFYGPGFEFEEISWLDAYDIDTLEDLKLAEILERGLREY